MRDALVDTLYLGERQAMQRLSIRRGKGNDLAGDFVRFAEGHGEFLHEKIGEIGRGRVALAGGGLHFLFRNSPPNPLRGN